MKNLHGRLNRAERAVEERLRPAPAENDFLRYLPDEEIRERLCKAVRTFEAEHGEVTPLPVYADLSSRDFRRLSNGQLFGLVKWTLLEAGEINGAMP